MTERTVLSPSADHPITVLPAGSRVVVKRGDHVVADSRDALVLREASYPAVHYLPRKDVDLALLERSEHTTYCPYKGEASYFSLPGVPNAIWSYESPHPAVSDIQDHVAFYPLHVEIGVLAD